MSPARERFAAFLFQVAAAFFVAVERFAAFLFLVAAAFLTDAVRDAFVLRFEVVRAAILSPIITTE